MRLEHIEVSEGHLTGNYAPLYHNTNFMAAIKILIANKIEARGHESRVVFDDRDITNRHPFVSLTRSYAFARTWRTKDVVFVMDQEKLRQDFKVIPFDYFSYLQHTDHKHGANGIYTDDDFSKRRRSEAEEYIMGDITPLNKYLLQILVSQEGVRRVKEIILTSPDVKNGAWKEFKNGKRKWINPPEFAGVNDPKIATDETFWPWANRTLILKHPKTKIIP